MNYEDFYDRLILKAGLNIQNYNERIYFKHQFGESLYGTEHEIARKVGIEYLRQDLLAMHGISLDDEEVDLVYLRSEE